MSSLSKRREKVPGQYREVVGILFLAIGVFFTLCLLSYHPNDPAFNSASSSEHIANLGGLVGAYMADLLLSILGISAYFLCGLFFLVSLLKFSGRPFNPQWKEALFFFAFVTFVSTLFHLSIPNFSVAGHFFPSGGLIGALTAKFLRSPDVECSLDR